MPSYRRGWGVTRGTVISAAVFIFVFSSFHNTSCQNKVLLDSITNKGYDQRPLYSAMLEQRNERNMSSAVIEKTENTNDHMRVPDEATTKDTPVEEHKVVPETLCELLQQKSPMQLWTENMEAIFNANKMPLDGAYKLHDITAHVLQIITPRLGLGQRSLPRQGVQAVLDKIQARWDFVNNKSTVKVKPLRIIVLGGYVTMGVACNTGIRKYDYNKCAWLSRLEVLINTLAGSAQMVEVINLAVGGSNTATGAALLQYDLVPP